MWEQHKETLRKLEGENENLREEVVHYSTQLEASVSKYNAAQQVIQELNIQVSRQNPQGGEELEPCENWLEICYLCLHHHRSATKWLSQLHLMAPAAPPLSLRWRVTLSTGFWAKEMFLPHVGSFTSYLVLRKFPVSRTEVKETSETDALRGHDWPKQD